MPQGFVPLQLPDQLKKLAGQAAQFIDDIVLGEIRHFRDEQQLGEKTEIYQDEQGRVRPKLPPGFTLPKSGEIQRFMELPGRITRKAITGSGQPVSGMPDIPAIGAIGGVSGKALDLGANALLDPLNVLPGRIQQGLMTGGMVGSLKKVGEDVLQRAVNSGRIGKAILTMRESLDEMRSSRITTSPDNLASFKSGISKDIASKIARKGEKGFVEFLPPTKSGLKSKLTQIFEDKFKGVPGDTQISLGDLQMFMKKLPGMGARQGELDWANLGDEWLSAKQAGKKHMTVDEIRKTVEERGLDVEVVKRGGQDEGLERLEKLLEEGGGPTGTGFASTEDYTKKLNILEQIQQWPRRQPPMYNEPVYHAPGPYSNHVETVISAKVPQTKELTEINKKIRELYESPLDQVGRQEVALLKKKQALEKRQFHLRPGHHFQEKDVLMHSWSTDREIAGVPSKHIEEFQADPSQGKRSLESAFAAGELSAEELASELPPKHPLIGETSTWVTTLVRKNIVDAIAEGKTRISWSSGKVIANRYGKLMENVAEVRWTKKLIELGSGRDPSKKVTRYEIEGFRKPDLAAGERDIPQSAGKVTVPPWKLESYVGKDMAKRIKDSASQSNLPGDIHGSIAGDNITVGASGFQKLYDEIWTNIMEKELKRWGVKAKRVTIPGGRITASSGDNPVWDAFYVDLPQDLIEAGKGKSLPFPIIPAALAAGTGAALAGASKFKPLPKPKDGDQKEN